MFTAIIYIHIRPEFRDAFIAASLENASNSIQEPGILRFDFLQQEDDPDRFMLYETYTDPDAQLRHRETAHYLRWRETVEGMMAEPRVAVRHYNLTPV